MEHQKTAKFVYYKICMWPRNITSVAGMWLMCVSSVADGIFAGQQFLPVPGPGSTEF